MSEEVAAWRLRAIVATWRKEAWRLRDMAGKNLTTRAKLLRASASELEDCAATLESVTNGT